jgi:hypothetical protein
MRKHISFAIAATIGGLAVVFWAMAGGPETFRGKREGGMRLGSLK